MSDNGIRVLVVDDEQAIRRFLKVALSAQGYHVIESSTGTDALSAAATQKPDLVILDLGLPDMDGVQVTRLLRQWSQLPIVVLSVRGSEGDKIAALDAGADDYLTKPFGVGELLARMRVALRRTSLAQNEPIFKNGDLVVDFPRRKVTVAEREVQLTPNEFDLLKTLAINSGKVLTHPHLLKEVWGAGYEQEFHILHVNVSNLRRKLEPDPSRPRFIITEPGVGYRLHVD